MSGTSGFGTGDPVLGDDKFTDGEGLELYDIPADDEVNASWCLRFMRAIRDCVFATLDENGRPRVHVIDVMAVTVDPGRLYFLTARGKRFYKEVMKQKYVSIVGQTADYRTCSLAGHVVHPESETEQHRLIDRLFELNPSMSVLYEGEKRYVLEVFYVDEGEGEYFDLGQKPVFRRSFSIGGEAGHDGKTTGGTCEQAGTYFIGDGCIGCGSCQRVCPTGCINGDKLPLEIDQEHCLRCGACYEACPVQAVIAR